MGEVLKRSQKVKRMCRELLFFPILLLYLEIVFHCYMKLDMRYLPAFGSMAIAIGIVVSSFCLLFPQKVSRILEGVFSLLFTVLFCVEMICKDIFQQYYQLFSVMDTAMNNHLSDYWKAVVSSLEKNWRGIFLLLVIPAVVVVRVVLRTKPIPRRCFTGIIRVLAVVSISMAGVLASLGVVNSLPYKGDLTPKELLKMDTNTDDQVEQLGMTTMLCLDVKNSLLGNSGTVILTPPEPENGESVENTEYSENVMDVDLQAIIDSAFNENVKSLTEYIQAVEPTNQNAFTGMFEGYNVIFITTEGFSGYMIDENLTPTLYRLANEGFVFKNFYSALHFTSTSGGEFQNLTGLYPKNGTPISMAETGKKGTYLPFTLANVLNEKDYTSIGYHFNENMYGRALSHPNLGYEWRQETDCQNPLVMETSESGKNIWPQSDDYMIEQTVQEYIGEEPFNIYYMTLSGHLPYGYSSNQMSVRNKEAVESLPYSEETKAYIAANLELEKALTRLISELEDAGIADKTLIVMASDHIPYMDIDILEELTGQSFGTDSLETINEKSIDYDVYRNTLIVWAASMENPVVVEKTCCQVDILPTLLNLLGVEYDSRMLAGTDILSDSEGLVVYLSNSWQTDYGLYNRYTGEFTLKEGVTMTEEEIDAYVERIKNKVSNRLAMTSIIIENDYYRLVFGK